jgi:mono/diheme cytochrome c family protein
MKYIIATLFCLVSSVTYASDAAVNDEVTFHKDIVPILQRSCQNCHRPEGVAPMPLVTYEETAPFAGLIEYKTGLRDRAGAMPPYYLEKDIGIQE